MFKMYGDSAYTVIKNTHVPIHIILPTGTVITFSSIMEGTLIRKDNEWSLYADDRVYGPQHFCMDIIADEVTITKGGMKKWKREKEKARRAKLKKGCT